MAVLEIRQDNFQTEVLESEKSVLIDFWASWCGPCKMMSPVVDEIAEEHTDIKVGKVNVDVENELASKYQVMSIPTLLLIKEGRVVQKLVGAQPKEAVLKMLL